MRKDRFQKIAHGYGELFNQVFAFQGLSYRVFEDSAFLAMVSYFPNFRDLNILDVGTGDGETLLSFVQAWCSSLTGIDLNLEMVEQVRERFSDRVRIFQDDACEFATVRGEKFDVIISAATLHNVARSERKRLWQHILDFNPSLFVNADKIADPDPKFHKFYYERELSAIKEIYKERHDLKEAATEWKRHYEWDEKQRLEISEMQEYLGGRYDIKVVGEYGMYKTVVCKRKKK